MEESAILFLSLFLLARLSGSKRDWILWAVEFGLPAAILLVAAFVAVVVRELDKSRLGPLSAWCVFAMLLWLKDITKGVEERPFVYIIWPRKPRGL